MNTTHIKYFLEVVNSGSINRASERLNINHQHLGRILTSLEDEIGAKLLERNRAGVTLTPQGLEVLGTLNEINELVSKLQYQFSIDSVVQKKKQVLKIYSFATSNYSYVNNIAKQLQKLLFSLQVEILEKSNQEIIEDMISSDQMCFGQLVSFDDYPILQLNSDVLSDKLKIIEEKYFKLVTLVSANNVIAERYSSISMDSLMDKPLVCYAPYGLEDNHFYKLMKIYGTPQLKYVTGNLQTFYDILKTTECVAIGVGSDNTERMFNSLFSKEQQFRAIPIRDNIQMKVSRVMNQKLCEPENAIIRELVEENFKR